MASPTAAAGFPNAAMTPQEKANFISALEEMPNVSRAARIIGRSRTAMYLERRDDEEFAKDWDDAIAGGVEHLEEILWSRAEDTSDVLGIFLLKAHNPRKYRERLDVTSNDETLAAGVTMIEVVVPPSQEEIAREASKLVARQGGKTEVEE